MKVNPKLRILAPKWYKIITRAKSYADLLKYKNDLDLSQFGMCVIGESHGFNANYCTDDQSESKSILIGCPTCTYYANEIYMPHKAKNRGLVFKQMIERFIIHAKVTHKMEL